MPDDSPAPKFTISSGLFEAKHREKMGSAIWMYGVLLDWQTDKDGTVMRGESIQASIVATRLGCNERTVRRELERLDAEGYIRRNRSGDGWQVWIINPKKRFREPDRFVRSSRTEMSGLDDEAGQKCPISRTEMSGLPDRNVRSDSSYSPKGINNLLREPNKPRVREAEPDFRETIAKLEAQHPEGHNPHPQMTAQMVLSRCNTAEDCAAIVADHAGWLPAWRAGRTVNDLHNWVSKWERGATPPAPQADKRSRTADTIAEMFPLPTEGR